jgi:hypothetical protein
MHASLKEEHDGTAIEHHNAQPSRRCSGFRLMHRLIDRLIFTMHRHDHRAAADGRRVNIDHCRHDNRRTIARAKLGWRVTVATPGNQNVRERWPQSSKQREHHVSRSRLCLRTWLGRPGTGGGTLSMDKRPVRRADFNFSDRAWFGRGRSACCVWRSVTNAAAAVNRVPIGPHSRRESDARWPDRRAPIKSSGASKKAFLLPFFGF